MKTGRLTYTTTVLRRGQRRAEYRKHAVRLKKTGLTASVGMESEEWIPSSERRGSIQLVV